MKFNAFVFSALAAGLLTLFLIGGFVCSAFGIGAGAIACFSLAGGCALAVIAVFVIKLIKYGNKK